MCGGITHPGDDEPVTPSFDDHVLVMKNGPADAFHVIQPAICLAEVLMVAGDVDAKRCGLYRSQWPCLPFSDAYRPANHSAHVGYNVGPAPVHPRRPAGRP